MPQVATIFQENKTALPLATQFLILLSNFLTGYWWLLALMAAGMVAGNCVGLTNPKGRRFFDTWILRVPYIGQTIRGPFAPVSRARSARCSPAACKCCRRWTQ